MGYKEGIYLQIAPSAFRGVLLCSKSKDKEMETHLCHFQSQLTESLAGGHQIEDSAAF